MRVASFQRVVTAGTAGDAETGTASSQLDADILRLREEFERLETAFASDAAVFRAAERHAQIAQQPAVDPDRAAVDRRGDAMRALEVARPERCGEAVARRVRERDRFLFAIERRDRDDGAEDLFLQHAAVAPEAGDHGRLDEVAVAIQPRAAAADHAPFFSRELDVGE